MYAVLGPQPTPWKGVGCGDGGYMVFLGTGDLLAGCTTGYDWPRARWNGSQFGSLDAVPVLNGPGSLAARCCSAGVEIVNTPRWRNGSNQLMYATAWLGGTLYGLYANSNGDNMHWERLGSVPVAANQYVTAVGSSDGFTVFVGTSEGRTFAFDTRSGSPLELNVPIRASQGSAIGRIIVQSTTQVYASLNSGSAAFILRLNGLRWDAVGAGTLFALEMDRTTNPPTLFAATDSRVYVSRDSGGTWQSASQGLTRRPHCADLRFVNQSDGAHFLYLSTYGRSVWRARLQ